MVPDDIDALVTYKGIVTLSLNVVFPLPEFKPPVKRFVYDLEQLSGG
jgi:hypothetical protein